MILKVTITKNDIIIDFEDFKITTGKDYIDIFKDIYWEDNCLMIETDDGLESIGIEHILFGEPPFFSSCDFKLIGIDIMGRDKLKEYMGKVKGVRWQRAE